MAHSATAGQSFLALARGFKRLQVSDPLAQCLAPRLTRSYATHTNLPTAPLANEPPVPNSSSTLNKSAIPSADRFRAPVVTTLYSWPSIEPTSFKSYPYHHLNLPLRRDILHRAVIYEGDMTRQGTASTKHRTQVHGSSRKIRPQKGTGSARLSDRKSPSIRGGGVAHGPHPRDFSTDLPKKVYDLAWRTALSYRYRKGELIVLNRKATLEMQKGPRWLDNFFRTHGWGQGNGRSLLVQASLKDDGKASSTRDGRLHLAQCMEQVGEHGEAADVHDVDVKDLLSFGRVIIEIDALNWILHNRNSDLKTA